MEKEIEKSNFMIALFMGAEKDGGSTMAIDGTYAHSYTVYPNGKYMDVTFHDKRTRNEIHSISNLQYHTSWDWLIPVVKKIQALGYRVNIHFWPDHIDRESGCEIACMIYDDIQHVNPAHWGENVLECTYSCVVEFVKSLNKSVLTMSTSNLSSIDTFQNKNRGFKEDERERFRNY